MEKQLKRIADELKLIRIELQKLTPPKIEIDGWGNVEKPNNHNAGERVTIK